MSDNDDNYWSETDSDSNDFEEPETNDSDVYYSHAQRLGVTRQLATLAIALSDGNMDKARNALQELIDLKEYLAQIRFARVSDDELLKYVTKRRVRPRSLHSLSTLTQDMNWFANSTLFSNLVDRNKSLCSQETIINAVCGDNPVCYETLMGFENIGNASYAHRLSRRLLRFMCHHFNTAMQQDYQRASDLIHQSIHDAWPQLAARSAKGLKFWITLTADTSSEAVTVLVNDCIEHLRNSETPPLSISMASSLCTASVFHTFVMTNVARVFANQKFNIERTYMNRQSEPRSYLQLRFI